MKGLYLLWADHIYIDKALEAGIDTLIVPFYSLPGDANDGAYFPTFDQAKDVLVRYKGKAKLIAGPVLYQIWAEIPEEDRFVQSGKSFPRHFCPTSEVYVERIMAPFAKLYAGGLIDEVMFDVEHYTGEPKMFSEIIKCECSRCLGMNHDDQWKRRASLIKKYPYVTGQFAHDSWWSLLCYNSPTVLNEGTYALTGFRARWDIWWAEKFMLWFHKVRYSTAPGAFIEIFNSTDKYLDYLKYLNKHYGGYWIYTQKMFSRWSKIPQSEIDGCRDGYGGYYETRLVDEVDPEFFKKLKALNG
jgi:hypothetical protein